MIWLQVVDGSARPAIDGGHRTKSTVGLISRWGKAASVKAASNPKHPETKNHRLSLLTNRPTKTRAARDTRNTCQSIRIPFRYKVEVIFKSLLRLLWLRVELT